jgi:hypothetical protein
VTGFEPAIPRSTICGADDVKSEVLKGLRIANPPFALPLPIDTCQGELDLREIVDAWRDLPEPVRASVLLLVRASLGGFQS